MIRCSCANVLIVIDAFVAKYDGAGNYIWAVSFAESDNSTGKALGIDDNANVYVTGNFSGAISFTNSVSYTSLGGNDVFISKLDATGGLVWGQRIGGSSLDNSGTANVGVARTFNDYFWKLTNDGGYILAKAYSATGSTRSVNVDAIGNIYTAGGQGAFNKWDNNGNLVYGYDYGVNNQCITHAVDAMQHVYTVGNFHGALDLDPCSDTAIVRVTVTSGIFVSKLTQLAAGSLPLTWINVEGHLNDWQQFTLNFTVNEENVECYTVEKSTDGFLLIINK